MDEKPLIVIAGPTGSGKSELGLWLAARLQGEVINCDSVQVYRGLEIGAAKTPQEERRGIPHHLVDVVGPDEELTAGDYQRLGRAAIMSVSQRVPPHLPIVVGGTGFYLRALLDGLSEVRGRNEELRARLRRVAEKRPGTLQRWSRRISPDATHIHPNDTQKLIRALEMVLLEGKPLRMIQSRPRDPLTGYRVLRVGLLPERSALYRRIESRCEQMFESGLLDETQRLIDLGYRKGSKALLSLGYRQAASVLAGEMTTAEALQQLKTKTRQYAKRQLTWFRADKSIIWLGGFGSDPPVQAEAFRLVSEHVTGSSKDLAV